mmetsp:Transcript_29309/g.68224  ORF Transcript_29309/g.68224 Transcript_29309/m.68224 type:complete len:261 (+) Transcript_29309:191-973(+)
MPLVEMHALWAEGLLVLVQPPAPLLPIGHICIVLGVSATIVTLRRSEALEPVDFERSCTVWLLLEEVNLFLRVHVFALEAFETALTPLTANTAMLSDPCLRYRLLLCNRFLPVRVLDILEVVAVAVRLLLVILGAFAILGFRKPCLLHTPIMGYIHLQVCNLWIAKGLHGVRVVLEEAFTSSPHHTDKLLVLDCQVHSEEEHGLACIREVPTPIWHLRSKLRHELFQLPKVELLCRGEDDGPVLALVRHVHHVRTAQRWV